MFRNPEESHQHSLETLNCLYEYDDFMASVRTMVDLGCGKAHDLMWWATATTRDEPPEPLNIQCMGVDKELISFPRLLPNLAFQHTDFEKEIHPKRNTLFDVLWCHDAFQYCLQPMTTLSRWWQIASPGAMLIIIVPQTTNFDRRQPVFEQPNYCYYHHTVVSLIHMLAVSGWDCRSGYFKKSRDDAWLHAVVYKSDHAPMDPATTTWYHLAELNLLPDSAVKSINAHGSLRQQDLVLPWLDKSLGMFV